MAVMNYMNFDIKIEGSAPKGYHAQLVNSPVGEAQGDFAAPLQDIELENLVLRVAGSRTVRRGLDSPEVDAAKKVGQKLYSAVFTDELRTALMRSTDRALQGGQGLRVRLHLGDAPDLADLPWEYLFDTSSNRFLSLSVETPLVRYLDLADPIYPIAVTPPLHVLAMISSPTDYPQLDVEKEWANLHNALGDLEQRGAVKLDRLETASLVALRRRLSQDTFHIFHFIGHGGFDERAGDGVLVFEDENKRGRQVSGENLSTLLHDHRTLRLVVLNACEGGRASRTDPFAGSAQRLIQQDMPAVIAMQFEISDEAAISFAHDFYGALSDGYPVDAALSEARKTIYAMGNALEWGTPVLYMRAPDGKIFDVAPAPQPAPVPPKPVEMPGPVKEQTAEKSTTVAASKPEQAPTPSFIQMGMAWVGAHKVIAAVVVLVLLALILYVLLSGGSGQAPIEEPTPQGFLVAFLLI